MKTTSIIILSLLLTLNQESIAQNNSFFKLEFKVGDTFPFSEIETMSGGSYSIDSLNTSLLVMNFWNTGCKPCIQELPFLNQISDHFKSKSISFWSITLNKKEKLTKHLEKHPIKWDFKGDVDYMGIFGGEQFNIRGVPTTIVINKDKRIIYAQSGAILDDPLGNDFIYMLEEELR